MRAHDFASLVTYSYCDPRVKEHHLLATLGPLYDGMRKQGQHIYVWVFMLSTITQGLIIQASVTKNGKVQFFLAAIEWVIIFIRQYCKPYHGKCNTWHIGCGYGRMLIVLIMSFFYKEAYETWIGWIVLIMHGAMTLFVAASICWGVTYWKPEERVVLDENRRNGERRDMPMDNTPGRLHI